MSQRFKPYETAIVPERALLVGVDLGERDEWPQDRSMAELERLVETDGAEVVGRLTQRPGRPVPKTYIGSGKTVSYLNNKSTDNRGVVWYFISYKGVNGWISSKYSHFK